MKQGDPIDAVQPGYLAIGLGCERGTDPSELIALVEQALALASGFLPGSVSFATLDTRCGEPAMTAVARHFSAPLQFFPANVLEALTPRLHTPSSLVFAHTGCHGVSEAAALALAGEDGVLVVPKLRSRHATVAIAMDISTRIQSFAGSSCQTESGASHTGSSVAVIGL